MKVRGRKAKLLALTIAASLWGMWGMSVLGDAIAVEARDDGWVMPSGLRLTVVGWWI